MLKHNLWQILIAFDQLLNTVFGLIFCYRAWADETISSQAYRWYMTGNNTWLIKIIDFIFLAFEKNHCQNSFESERLSRHLPPELR